jgi:hypothetical protein
MTQRSVVVGVFDNRGKAESAIDELRHAGFPPEQMGIAGPGEPMHKAETAVDTREHNAAEGAISGAISGGMVGAVAGAVATAAIPGVGPFIAGGLLAGIVGGTAAGAAAGAFLGPFIAMGFTEDEAKHYDRELRSGRTLVTVQADGRAGEVVAVLRRHGAIGTNPPPNITSAARPPADTI